MGGSLAGHADVGELLLTGWESRALVESLSDFNGIQPRLSGSSVFQGSLYRSGFSLRFFSSK